MAAYAFAVTGGSLDRPLEVAVLWGSAVAAAVAAMVVATRGPAAVAWIAIGYILFAGLLAVAVPQVLVVSLAVALMPVVPRPRERLALGLAIAAGTALIAEVAGGLI